MRSIPAVVLAVLGAGPLLWACDSGAPPAESPSRTVPCSPIPEGFVAVIPGPEDFDAANSSPRRWRVALSPAGTEVVVTPCDESARDTGPPLPFALPESRVVQLARFGSGFDGDRHVLALEDGFLVGIDCGEWGGTLDFYDRSGKHVTQHVEDNTQGVLLLEQTVVSLHGLNHLGGREGCVRFWRRDHDTFLPDGESRLDGGPECFVVADGILWVLTSNGLWRVTGHEVLRMHEVDVVMLYPNSLVVDAAGDVWAGMRRFVLHLKKHGKEFTEEWLAPKPAAK